MSGWLPIRYRDFHDVPRLLVVEHHGHLYVFNAPFDDDADEYSDHYTVYVVPETARPMVELDSWANLPAAGESIGEVRVADVEFDESRRRLINADVFDKLRGET